MTRTGHMDPGRLREGPHEKVTEKKGAKGTCRRNQRAKLTLKRKSTLSSKSRPPNRTKKGKGENQKGELSGMTTNPRNGLWAGSRRKNATRNAVTTPKEEPFFLGRGGRNGKVKHRKETGTGKCQGKLLLRQGITNPGRAFTGRNAAEVREQAEPLGKENTPDPGGRDPRPHKPTFAPKAKKKREAKVKPAGGRGNRANKRHRPLCTRRAVPAFH